MQVSHSEMREFHTHLETEHFTVRQMTLDTGSAKPKHQLLMYSFRLFLEAFDMALGYNAKLGFGFRYCLQGAMLGCFCSVFYYSSASR